MTEKVFNICPRCGEPFRTSALSRLDNKTRICSPCGNWEAMMDYRFLMNTGSIEQINDVLNILGTIKGKQGITNKHEFKYFEKIETILNVKLEKLNKSN